MEGINEYLNSISEIRQTVKTDSDYTNSEGLLVCGICNRKKQARVMIGGTYRIVNCICDCESARREEKEMEFREQEDVRNIARLRTASLMDDKFRDATFANFETNDYNRKNLKLCNRYCSAFGRMLEGNQGLLFWGRVGTGKSYAAACIANELLSKGTPVIITSFVKMIDLVRQSAEKEHELIRSLESTKLVIFDDLGAERNTDYALEKVYNIIDSRYRAKLPMILTTNLTIQDMKDESDIRYKRIYDRIFEVCYPMEFTGPSWRRRIAGARFEEMKSLLIDD